MNKTDLVNDESFAKAVSNLEPLMEQYDWASISAKKRDGIDELIDKLLEKVKNLPPKNDSVAAPATPVQKMMPAQPVLEAASPVSTTISSIGPPDDPNNCACHEDKNEDEEEDLDKPPAP